MGDLVPKDIGEPKFGIKPKIYKVLVWAGMAIFVYVLGFFLTPGVPDEIVAEIAWVIIIAIFEIKKKIDSSKKK